MNTILPFWPIPQDRPQSFEEAIDEMLLDLKATLIARGLEYGHRTITKAGEDGCITFAHMKLYRAEELIDKREVLMTYDQTDQKYLDDSWLDAAGYCILGRLQHHFMMTLPKDIDDKEKFRKWAVDKGLDPSRYIKE
jgi:hypothetical protein